MKIRDYNFKKKKDSLEEVTKGERRMPGLLSARKDVESCEKVRGSANRKRSAHIRMGEPAMLKA